MLGKEKRIDESIYVYECIICVQLRHMVENGKIHLIMQLVLQTQALVI